MQLALNGLEAGFLEPDGSYPLRPVAHKTYGRGGVTEDSDLDRLLLYSLRRILPKTLGTVPLLVDLNLRDELLIATLQDSERTYREEASVP